MQPIQPKELKEPCRRCGAVAWERLPRETFFEDRILPFFNLYPWRCALCNRRRYIAQRHDPDLLYRQMHDEA